VCRDGPSAVRLATGGQPDQLAGCVRAAHRRGRGADRAEGERGDQGEAAQGERRLDGDRSAVRASTRSAPPDLPGSCRQCDVEEVRRGSVRTPP
jgi:hypothetical protein